jgi:hypothetical protein
MPDDDADSLVLKLEELRAAITVAVDVLQELTDQAAEVMARQGIAAEALPAIARARRALATLRGGSKEDGDGP